MKNTDKKHLIYLMKLYKNKTMVTAKNRRRYKLHYKLRKRGGQILTKERTVLVNYTQEESELPKEAIELRNKFGYSIQMQINQ